MTNTGDRNTGYCNTGDYNTGHRNTGDYNTGHHNTGDYNTGNHNTGDYNTGYCNTGNHNTGHYNTGNWNSVSNEVGYFNTEETKLIRVFNNPCDLATWEKAIKPSFLYFKLTIWVTEEKMNDQEKKDNPSYRTTGGYLKKLDYKEAFKRSFENASKEEIDLLKKLPNFDAEVFKEISGIDLTEKTCNNKIVEIDGKKYRLVEEK